MPDLPARPDLEQLRHQARDLQRAAQEGDATALRRIRQASSRVTLAGAQLAIARSHGFPSWPRLKAAVDLRRILNDRSVDGLDALLGADPAVATARMEHWCDHRGGVGPLNYIAMLRFDSGRLGLSGALPGTGAIASALLAAGAMANGDPRDRETPLMTAASYGDAEVAGVLLEAGADLEATAAPDAGGVPGGTALQHAAVFGMTDVVDLLVAAGARIESLEMAAAAGDVGAWPLARAPLQSRIRALVFAADHQRLGVIDALVNAGTPIDADDARWGRQALRVAARNGRAASVQRLLARGANPDVRDVIHNRTALDWCRPGCRYHDGPGHDEVEQILSPLTSPAGEADRNRDTSGR